MNVAIFKSSYFQKMRAEVGGVKIDKFLNLILSVFLNKIQGLNLVSKNKISIADSFFIDSSSILTGGVIEFISILFSIRL